MWLSHVMTRWLKGQRVRGGKKRTRVIAEPQYRVTQASGAEEEATRPLIISRPSVAEPHDGVVKPDRGRLEHE